MRRLGDEEITEELQRIVSFLRDYLLGSCRSERPTLLLLVMSLSGCYPLVS